MPVLSTVGAASLRAFGAFRQGAVAAGFISATGGTITTSGNYKYHTFTSDDTFSVTSVPSGRTIDILLVGGGGGDGGNYGGGGGGGLIIREGESIGTGSYSVVIGQGGSTGNNGGDTVAIGFTALGGGAGGGIGSLNPGKSGGSGGGSGVIPGTTSTASSAGAGLQPTSASGGFGNYGGTGTPDGSGSIFGGAGGGAGGAGNVYTAGPGKSGSPLSNDTFARGGSTSYTGAANSGDGGGYLGTASAGRVIIRYLYQ